MLHTNESCHPFLNGPCCLRMRHATYELVLSHMNGPSDKWMRHVTYEWVTLHSKESSHWMSHVAYEWVMSCANESRSIWISRVAVEGAIVTVGRAIHECVMLHTNESRSMQRSRVITYMNEPCHTWTSHVTYEWAMSYMTIYDMARVTYTNESRYIQRSVRYTNESRYIQRSCVTYECAMSYMNESCRIWTGTRSRLRHAYWQVQNCKL